MGKRITKAALLAFRLGLMLLFLVMLLAINFENPKDIISVTTLRQLTHPALLWKNIHANTGIITSLIAHAHMGYLWAAFIVHLACIALLSLRWQLLLRAQLIHIPFYKLFAYYLIGFFFNNFLPTNIGGDLSRIYNTAHYREKSAESFAVVFIERFIGFSSVFLLALVALFFNFSWLQNHTVFYAVLLFAIGIAGIFIVFFNASIRVRIKSCIAAVGFLQLNEKLTKFYQAIFLFRDKTFVLAQVMLLSLLYQLVLVIVNVFAARSMGASPPFLPVLLTLQITTLIGLVPVTPGGIGIKENFYVVLLHSAIPDDSAIKAFLIVLLLINYAESLIGGFCYLLQKNIHKKRLGRTIQGPSSQNTSADIMSGLNSTF